MSLIALLGYFYAGKERTPVNIPSAIVFWRRDLTLAKGEDPGQNVQSLAVLEVLGSLVGRDTVFHRDHSVAALA